MKRIAVFFLCALPLVAASDDSFLLRNVTIHPVSGPDIAAGSLLVRDGKIAEAGVKVSAPKGIRVIDGQGLHVYPGLIDSATEMGLSEIGSVRETVDTTELGDFKPQLRAEIAINPSSEHIPVARANGITSVIVLPLGGIVSGQAPLIHMDGWTWEEMELRRTAAMAMIFPSIQEGGRRGAGSRGTAPTPFPELQRTYEKRLADLREFFESARRYRQAKLANEPGLKADLKFEAMLPVLDGKTPLLVQAARERAIRAALEFAKTQKVRIILAEPREIDKVSGEIKAANIPVILGPVHVAPLNEDDPYDKPFTLPGELFRAGVKFAFGTFNTSASRNLPYQVGTAVAFGLPYEEGLKAITLNAAEIWGVADQLGSIEKGKWADLMVTNGDPLEPRTEVKQVFIKGKQIDLDNKHLRLYQKYWKRP